MAVAVREMAARIVIDPVEREEVKLDLGMAVDEWYTWKASQGLIKPQPWILSETTTENRDDALVDEVVVRHAYFDAEGSTTDETKAKDESRSFDVPKEIDNAWNED